MSQSVCLPFNEVIKVFQPLRKHRPKLIYFYIIYVIYNWSCLAEIARSQIVVQTIHILRGPPWAGFNFTTTFIFGHDSVSFNTTNPGNIYCECFSFQFNTHFVWSHFKNYSTKQDICAISHCRFTIFCIGKLLPSTLISLMLITKCLAWCANRLNRVWKK